MEFRCRLGTAGGEIIEGVYVAESEARLRRDDRRRGDVTARPQILGQRRGDERVEVKAFDHAFRHGRGPRSPWPTVPLASVSIASRLFLAWSRRPSSISTRGVRSRSARYSFSMVLSAM
mgnify:CR=1 FL=1